MYPVKIPTWVKIIQFEKGGVRIQSGLIKEYLHHHHGRMTFPEEWHILK
jgi:hypothetical protein